jgi:DNA mismatch repair protein MutS2
MGQSLRALEFPALLEIVAGFAYSPLGAEAIASLRPSSDAGGIARAQKPVTEIMGLLRRGEALPLSKIADCRAIIESIESVGGFVEAKDWLHVLHFLDAIDSARSFFISRYESCPVCSAMALDLDALPDLSGLIHKTIDQDGEVKDGASPELARLRKEIRRALSQMQRKMDELLGSLAKSGALQGSYWTLRRGRNVLPVRATH